MKMTPLNAPVLGRAGYRAYVRLTGDAHGLIFASLSVQQPLLSQHPPVPVGESMYATRPGARTVRPGRIEATRPECAVDVRPVAVVVRRSVDLRKAAAAPAL